MLSIITIMIIHDEKRNVKIRGEKVENLTIRRKLKEAEVFQWEISERLGISEMTLVRKLRRELPEAEKQKIFSAIEEIAVEKNNRKN